MSVHSRCRKAAKAFDMIVEDKPQTTHERLAGAVQCIVRLRDALIAARRADASAQGNDKFLVSVNSILSLASSAEFPLVGIRWERVIAIRDALHVLVDQECVGDAARHDGRLPAS